MNYRPPELLRQSGLYPAAPATDVWSFGCTIWEAACHAKEPLFPGISEPTVLAQVLDFQTACAAGLTALLNAQPRDRRHASDYFWRMASMVIARVGRAGACRGHVAAFCCPDPEQRNSTGLGHPLRRAPAPATSEVQTPAFPN